MLDKPEFLVPNYVLAYGYLEVRNIECSKLELLGFVPALSLDCRSMSDPDAIPASIHEQMKR